ncbi:MAG: hypothetical protein JFR41_06325 [Muribaculaceae bacterium]|nr:hypothetical protein [Muribaculaceae bacterium]
MRKIIPTLLVIFLVSFAVEAIPEFRKTEAPDELADSCEVSLYEYYMSFQYPSYMKLHITQGYTAVIPGCGGGGYATDTIGEWRVMSDTLMIYENYFWPGIEPDITDEELLKVGYMFPLTDAYRGIYPLMSPYSEYPFAANVSAFRLKGYGNNFRPIESWGPDFGYRYVPASLFKYFCWDNVVPDVWMWTGFDWRGGLFSVRNKVVVGGRTLIVDIEKEGVVFQIVNPVCYLKSDSVRYYRKEQEAELSGWLDTVRVGQSYRFSLQRPAYPADSLAKVKYLRTLPDSLYISNPIEIDKLTAEQLEEIRTTVNPDTCREAYGYFFAKLIKI